MNTAQSVVFGAIEDAKSLIDVVNQQAVPQPAHAILVAQVFILVKKLEYLKELIGSGEKP